MRGIWSGFKILVIGRCTGGDALNIFRLSRSRKGRYGLTLLFLAKPRPSSEASHG